MIKNMITRKVEIDSKEMVKLFEEKSEIIKREEAMVEEHNKFREDFAKRTTAIKKEYKENEEKAQEIAKEFDIEIGEFERVTKSIVEDGKFYIEVEDKIEQFKELYRDSEKKKEEEKK